MLAHVLCKLNARHDYGLDLLLLSVDEGIAGYRDASLDAVRRNRDTHGVPLRIVSYAELYGWSMDDIVASIGRRNNCTFCGVFRRQALDRGAALAGADVIATGHNADDVAETIVMNLLRGDVGRLGRSMAARTGGGVAGVRAAGMQAGDGGGEIGEAAVSAAPAPVATMTAGAAAGSAGTAPGHRWCGGAPSHLGRGVGVGNDASGACVAPANPCACASTGPCAARGLVALAPPASPLAECRGGDTSRRGGAPAPPLAVPPRVKPFLRSFEKEIVLYAHHARLDYVCA